MNIGDEKRRGEVIPQRIPVPERPATEPEPQPAREPAKKEKVGA